MMKIAAGIKGIKQTLAENASGWHVFLDGEYARFIDDTLAEARTFYADCTLIGVQGNTLSFITKR